MAKRLAAKPKRDVQKESPLDINEEVVQDVIKKGGSAAAATSQKTTTEKRRPHQTTVSLRLYPAMLQQVQEIVDRQPIKTSRNTWMVQAILEKIQRETVSE